MSDEERAAFFRENVLLRKMRRQDGHLKPAEADELKRVRQLLGRNEADVLKSDQTAAARPGSDKQVALSSRAAPSSGTQASRPNLAVPASSQSLQPASPDYDAILDAVEDPHLFDDFVPFSSSRASGMDSPPSVATSDTSTQIPAANSQSHVQHPSTTQERGQASTSTTASERDYVEWLNK